MADFGEFDFRERLDPLQMPLLPRDGVVMVDAPRPEPEGSCRMIDRGVQAALQSVLNLPEAAQVRRQLQDEARRRCNELPEGARIALIATAAIAAGSYAAHNLEKLGNRSYSLKLPIDKLDVPGSLSVGVSLRDGKVNDWTVMYRLELKF